MAPSREHPGGFCDVGCCFTSLEVFHFIGFRRHPSPFSELLPGFYTHFILSSQLIVLYIAKRFFSLFWAFHFTANATVLSGVFLPARVFLPSTPPRHFDTFCYSDSSRNTPSRFFLYVGPHIVVPSG